MKFLIFGLGSIGRRHLNVLRDLGQNEFYCIRSGKSGTGTPDVVKELNQLSEINDLEIDAALITNPTSEHVSTALKLAESGIPMFIEKPLGKDMTGVDELSKLCREKNIPVLMGYNFLHHPAIGFIGELISDGKAGKVICARSQFGTYMPGWHKDEDHLKSYAAMKELGGGVVLTSIHELNYLSSYFGAVTEVKAMQTSGNVTGIECEEGVEMLIKHETGVVSSVHLNFFQKPYFRNCQIIGTKGTIYWDFMRPEVKFMQSEHSEVWRIGSGAYELLAESYKNQMKHFMEVVKRESIPVATLDDGIRDLAVCMKVFKEIGRD